jgi:CRISPR-associated exonuclease Cas4
MYNEDDLLPISALQHWLFCSRQCGLIHLEQAWSENKLTAQGRQLHDRAHEPNPESRGDTRIARALRLCSYTLGLAGQADVVELARPGPACPSDQQAAAPGLEGQWTFHPVEYKRGRPKQIDCDRVQLCAQAICLEEMLRVAIPQGSLFYGEPRRRESVVFDDRLRDATRRAAADVHDMIRSGVTPQAPYAPKCRSCSLIDSCMPKRKARAASAQRYLSLQLDDAMNPDQAHEEGNEYI